MKTVEHKDALIYTNKLFRDFYSKLYVQLIRSAPLGAGLGLQAERRAVEDRPAPPSPGPAQRGAAGEVHPEIPAGHHGLHAFHAGRDHLAPDLARRCSMRISRLWSRTWTCTPCGSRGCFTATLSPSRRRRCTSRRSACRRSGSRSPASRSTPRSREPSDRAEIRYRNHLDPEKTTLLVSAGALGVTPAEFVVARLLQLRHDVQGVVICGRNDELRHRLKEHARAARRAVQGDRLHGQDA